MCAVVYHADARECLADGQPMQGECRAGHIDKIVRKLLRGHERAIVMHVVCLGSEPRVMAFANSTRGIVAVAKSADELTEALGKLFSALKQSTRALVGWPS